MAVATTRDSGTYLDATSMWFELNPENDNPLNPVARQINATAATLSQPTKPAASKKTAGPTKATKRNYL